MKKFKHWQVFDRLPDGWVVDKTAGSPLHGHEFCHNGKSILNGGMRALFRVVEPQMQIRLEPPKQPLINHDKNKEPEQAQVIDAVYTRTLNELARQRFKQSLLNDILCDLMICDIEGWGKMEYINEIRRLINEIGSRVTIES